MFKVAERQLSFEDAQVMCGGLMASDSFFSLLGKHGHEWISDEDYSGMYSLKTGRGCVPPSLLVRALFLQNYRACSDRELVERIRFDLRYKVGMGVAVDYPAFDPSLLSIFRARLILHANEGWAFYESVRKANESGMVGDCQPLDSMPILGAAALQDTHTLLRTAIEKGLEAIRTQRKEWEGSRGFQYPFSSKKYKKGMGKPDINWNDETQRQSVLDELVKDAAALVEAIEASKMAASEMVQPYLALLKRILTQDIEKDESGSHKIKRGSKDRVLSTNDPEARHGHKTSCRLIKGYKGHFVVSEQEIVTALEVTAANKADAEPVPSMIDDLKRRGVCPDLLPGDCAYGGADFRAAMLEKGVEVLAKVPHSPPSKRYSKTYFKIDLEQSTVTCPAGQTASNYSLVKDDQGREVKKFRFEPEKCLACPLKDLCTCEPDRGRKIQLHYNELELQKARLKAAEPDFRQQMKRRLVVERVQARLQSYGLDAARYGGEQKVRLQAFFTAAVNNFWRVVTHPQPRGAP